MDLLEVQRILGHGSILTTARYTHLTQQGDAQANARIDSLMARFKLDWDGVR